jgi:hypothetical protein
MPEVLSALMAFVAEHQRVLASWTAAWNLDV